MDGAVRSIDEERRGPSGAEGALQAFLSKHPDKGAAKTEASLWQGRSHFCRSLPGKWTDTEYQMVGETMGKDFFMVEAGQVLGGVGLDLEQEGAGPVYVAGKRMGGPAALCGELLTEHGVERGQIQDNDVLLAIDGKSVKTGVDSDATMQAVRKGILGPPGTIVMLHFEREVVFRYHVKLTRIGPKQATAEAAEAAEASHASGPASMEVAGDGTRIMSPGVVCQKCCNSFSAKGCPVCPMQERVDILLKNINTLEGKYTEACARASAAEGRLMRKAKEEDVVRELFKNETNEVKLNRMKLRLSMAFQKWFLLSLDKAFSVWAEATDEQKRLRQLEIKAMRQFNRLNRSMVETMEKWWHQVVRKRKALKAVTMWTRGAFARAWNTWDAFVRERRRLLGVSAKVVCRWRNRVLAEAMESLFIERCRSRKSRVLVLKFFNNVLARSWNTWCEAHSRYMKPLMRSMVSLEVPVTDRHTLLFSQQHRDMFEKNIKVQVCATLDIPPAFVTVFVVSPWPDENKLGYNIAIPQPKTEHVSVKVILSDVVDKFGNVAMKAKEMMVPLAEAAIDPGSKFNNDGIFSKTSSEHNAAGDLPAAVQSQTLGLMSFPVAEFLESLARQVLQLQSVSQPRPKSEDKGIIVLRQRDILDDILTIGQFAGGLAKVNRSRPQSANVLQRLPHVPNVNLRASSASSSGLRSLSREFKTFSVYTSPIHLPLGSERKVALTRRKRSMSDSDLTTLLAFQNHEAEASDATA